MPRVCHKITRLRVGDGRADRGLHAGRVRQLDAEPRVHVLGETTAIPAGRRIAPVHVWRALVLERVGDQGGGRIRGGFLLVTCRRRRYDRCAWFGA